MWLAGWVQPWCQQGAVRGWGWGCSLVSGTYSPCVIKVQPQHSPHRHAHSWGPWENKKMSLVITGKPTGPGVPSDLGLPRGHCPPIKRGSDPWGRSPFQTWSLGDPSWPSHPGLLGVHITPRPLAMSFLRRTPEHITSSDSGLSMGRKSKKGSQECAINCRTGLCLPPLP